MPSPLVGEGVRRSLTDKGAVGPHGGGRRFRDDKARRGLKHPSRSRKLRVEDTGVSTRLSGHCVATPTQPSPLEGEGFFLGSRTPQISLERDSFIRNHIQS